MPSLTLDPQDGTEPLVLDWQAGYLVHAAPLGLELAPRTLNTRRRLVADGLDVDSVVVGARDVTVPLHVYGDDRTEYLARRRRLQAIVTASRRRQQPLRIVHAEDDGEVMWLAGYYVGGMEGDSGRAAGNTWSTYATVFRCAEPWWRMAERVDTWSLGEAAGWFPFPPLRLSASTIGGRFALTNIGDVETHARWEVTGPGSRLEVINHDTGQSIAVVTPLGDGERLTIDTRPGQRNVRRRPPMPTGLVEQRRNLHRNPGVEVDPGGWNSNDGTRYTSGLSTTRAKSGAASFTLTRTQTGPSTIAGSLWTHGIKNGGANALPATPGQGYSGSMAVYTDAPGRKVDSCYLVFRDAANASLGSFGLLPANTASHVPLTAGAWTTVTCPPVTAPAGTAAMYLVVTVSATDALAIVPTGEVTFFDEAYLGPAGGYFDGTTAATGPAVTPGTFVYSWAGTAHASESIEQLVVELPDTDPGIDATASVESDPEFWALAPGDNDVEVLLFGAGAASRVQVAYEPLRESV